MTNKERDEKILDFLLKKDSNCLYLSDGHYHAYESDVGTPAYGLLIAKLESDSLKYQILEDLINQRNSEDYDARVYFIDGTTIGDIVSSFSTDEMKMKFLNSELFQEFADASQEGEAIDCAEYYLDAKSKILASMNSLSDYDKLSTLLQNIGSHPNVIDHFIESLYPAVCSLSSDDNKLDFLTQLGYAKDRNYCQGTNYAYKIISSMYTDDEKMKQLSKFISLSTDIGNLQFVEWDYDLWAYNNSSEGYGNGVASVLSSLSSDEEKIEILENVLMPPDARVEIAKSIKDDRIKMEVINDAMEEISTGEFMDDLDDIMTAMRDAFDKDDDKMVNDLEISRNFLIALPDAIASLSTDEDKIKMLSMPYKWSGRAISTIRKSMEDDNEKIKNIIPNETTGFQLDLGENSQEAHTNVEISSLEFADIISSLSSDEEKIRLLDEYKDRFDAISQGIILGGLRGENGIEHTPSKSNIDQSTHENEEVDFKDLSTEEIIALNKVMKEEIEHFDKAIAEAENRNQIIQKAIKLREALDDRRRKLDELNQMNSPKKENNQEIDVSGT